MKIHFACGRQVLDGFYNIDAIRHPNAPRDPELIFEMRFDGGKLVEQMPLGDGSADEFHAFHILEHFYRYDVDAAIEEWKRLLRSGGRMVLELPNLEAACRNLLAGMRDQMCMWPLYGDPSWGSPYMIHRWGYTPTTITGLLAEHGFTKIQVLPPQTHKARANRDMRVEAVKCS
jgi:predicted SAM-dependent methyltransferase